MTVFWTGENRKVQPHDGQTRLARLRSHVRFYAEDRRPAMDLVFKDLVWRQNSLAKVDVFTTDADRKQARTEHFTTHLGEARRDLADQLKASRYTMNAPTPGSLADRLAGRMAAHMLATVAKTNAQRAKDEEAKKDNPAFDPKRQLPYNEDAQILHSQASADFNQLAALANKNGFASIYIQIANGKGEDGLYQRARRATALNLMDLVQGKVGIIEGAARIDAARPNSQYDFNAHVHRILETQKEGATATYERNALAQGYAERMTDEFLLRQNKNRAVGFSSVYFGWDAIGRFTTRLTEDRLNSLVYHQVVKKVEEKAPEEGKAVFRGLAKLLSPKWSMSQVQTILEGGKQSLGSRLVGLVRRTPESQERAEAMGQARALGLNRHTCAAMYNLIDGVASGRLDLEQSRDVLYQGLRKDAPKVYRAHEKANGIKRPPLVSKRAAIGGAVGVAAAALVGFVFAFGQNFSASRAPALPSGEVLPPGCVPATPAAPEAKDLETTPYAILQHGVCANFQSQAAQRLPHSEAEADKMLTAVSSSFTEGTIFRNAPQLAALSAKSLPAGAKPIDEDTLIYFGNEVNLRLFRGGAQEMRATGELTITPDREAQPGQPAGMYGAVIGVNNVRFFREGKDSLNNPMQVTVAAMEFKPLADKSARVITEARDACIDPNRFQREVPNLLERSQPNLMATRALPFGQTDLDTICLQLQNHQEKLAAQLRTKGYADVPPLRKDMAYGAVVSMDGDVDFYRVEKNGVRKNFATLSSVPVEVETANTNTQQVAQRAPAVKAALN